jgi:hypothetical protein
MIGTVPGRRARLCALAPSQLPRPVFTYRRRHSGAARPSSGDGGSGGGSGALASPPPRSAHHGGRAGSAEGGGSRGPAKGVACKGQRVLCPSQAPPRATSWRSDSRGPAREHDVPPRHRRALCTISCGVPASGQQDQKSGGEAWKKYLQINTRQIRVQTTS